MNINENIRNKRKIVKIKGVYMQIYPHLSAAAYYPILQALVPV